LKIEVKLIAARFKGGAPSGLTWKLAGSDVFHQSEEFPKGHFVRLSGSLNWM
jgi:hypothetical protein